jgi:hypothetical protein
MIFSNSPRKSKQYLTTWPLLQGTQITNNGDPNIHIQCINETMSFRPESFTVPNQVVRCLIITCTLRNLLRCDRTDQCPEKTLDTVQTNILFSFWPSNQAWSCTSGKIEWASLPVSAESHFACHVLISAGLVKLWKSLAAACRACSAHRPAHLSPVPRDTEFTPFLPQLRSSTDSNAIFYIHTPEGELDVQFS